MGAGGLLAGACPLPADWERGVSFQDTACLVPTVMGECPTCLDDLKPTQRAGTETFRPVSLISAVECSTFGGIDVREVASATTDETASFALARELLTGQASTRDANPNAQDDDPGNPSLQCNSTNLGDEFVDPIEAVGCIEQALADATGGRRGVILVGPEIALAMHDILRRDTGILTTLTGTRVIVDGGFDGRPPVCDESPGCELWDASGAPSQGDQLYIYATSSVWAGVGADLMAEDINRATNTANARAERVALAAFTPCATFAAGSGVLKAC